MLGQRGDERNELGLQLGEQGGHLGRPAPGVEVVEQHVVGAIELVEAVRVAAGQLVVPRQVRGERREVAVRARLHPGLLADRCGMDELAGEVGRNPARLLVVTPDDRHQPGVVGVEPRAVDGAGGGVEQPSGFGADELVVADPLERGEGLGSALSPARGHHRLLIPPEQLGCISQIHELRQVDFKFL